MRKEICISLLALSLVACGGDSSNDDSSDSDVNNNTDSSAISISSYSSANATDNSPVGTWVAILTGTHFIDDVENNTYQRREIFTIEEQGDNYMINSCDIYQPNSLISKSDFLIAKSENNIAEDYSSLYTQTFTSNTDFTSTSGYTENVDGLGEEQDSIEKWIEAAAAIKISDSVNISETISISSQNSDLANDTIEINCFSVQEGINGISTLEINSINNIEMFLENDTIGEDHTVSFDSNSLSFEESSKDDGIDISFSLTNNTVDNYTTTVVYSDPSRSGTFNISIDFK
jgi:hypothetical protein